MRAPFILIIASLAFWSTSGEEVGTCGPERADEFDECFARALMVGRNQTFPNNIGEVQALCSESRENLRCIKSFTDSCLSGMQKQSSSLLAKGVRNNVRDFCKAKGGRVKAMRTSKCAKQINTDLKQMMGDFADDYREVDLMEGRDKVTGLCCGYHRFISRLIAQSSSVCAPSGVLNLRKYIDNISGDIINLFCSGYAAESPQCLALLKNETKTQPEAGRQKTSTFIPPLLIAVENF